MSSPAAPSGWGITFALTAAVLFGGSTPFAKVLAGSMDPVLLAGLLYLGSGCGLTAWWLFRGGGQAGAQEAPLRAADYGWLAGAILFGGVIGPVLLMSGLAATPASTASLLLNLEGVLTAVLAWCVFQEAFDRQVALGMAAITAGGVVLSWEGWPEAGLPWGLFAIAGACLAWAIDNNVTRNVSAGDPVQVAGIKGLAAGLASLAIALARGAELPGPWTVLACGVLGLAGYGASLTLFVLALRSLGRRGRGRTSAWPHSPGRPSRSCCWGSGPRRRSSSPPC